jgi:hypothetical protein
MMMTIRPSNPILAVSSLLKEKVMNKPVEAVLFQSDLCKKRIDCTFRVAV